MRYIIAIIWILILNATTYANIQEQVKFINAEKVEFNEKEQYIEATGKIKIIIQNYLMEADKLLYNIQQNTLYATGNIFIKDNANNTIVNGNTVIFTDKFKHGVITQFLLYFKNTNSTLVAKAASKADNTYNLGPSRYTACNICNGPPVWQIRSQSTTIDLKRERVVYKNLFFEVYGVPIIFIPKFMHPTPEAHAQSGILAPEIKFNSLKIPLYYRARSNLDMTFTPRLLNKGQIYEGEMRYLGHSGMYKIIGSIGCIKETDNTNLPKKRYHVLSTMDSNISNIYYGGKIEAVSDAAYLQNYYKRYVPYVDSNLYTYTVNDTYAFSMNALNFYNLSKTDPSFHSYSSILPLINIHKIMPLGDDIQLSLKTETLGYRSKNNNIYKTSNTITLDKAYDTQNGHLFNFTLYDRLDYFYTNRYTPKSNFVRNIPELHLMYDRIDYSHTSRHALKSNFVRNIPELHLNWRYPLSSYFSDYHLIIEPRATAIYGREMMNKYYHIDHKFLEISDINIFSPNRYSGTDLHEFGSRVMGGVNSTINTPDYSILSFLGYSYKSLPDDPIQKAATRNIVGKIGINFNYGLEMFYRFNKHVNKLSHGLNEAELRYRSDKLNSKLNFIKIISANKDSSLIYFCQIYLDTNYKISDNWSVGTDFRLIPIPAKSYKVKLLGHGMRATYSMDCVNISFLLYNNYMDNDIGIKKSRSFSFAIGLKTLNM